MHSRQRKSQPISELLGERKRIVEILLVAMLLALGVALLANGLTVVAGDHGEALILGGAAAIVIAVVLSAAPLVFSLSRKETIAGFFLYSAKDNRVIGVPRHGFSDGLADYLQAAFNENTALKRSWDLEPLSSDAAKPAPGGTAASHQIIREAAECYLISQLATHIDDFFNGIGEAGNPTITLQRKDLGEVLLANRFIELLSQPIENRPAFEGHPRLGKNDDVVMEAYLPANAGSARGVLMFERFDLRIPKGARISRRNGAVVFDTSHFALEIGVRFGGFHTYVPYQLVEAMREPNARDHLTTFLIEVVIETRFKPIALVSGRWASYRWLDSLVDHYVAEISRDAFLASMDWEAALTVADLVEARIRDAKLR